MCGCAAFGSVERQHRDRAYYVAGVLLVWTCVATLGHSALTDALAAGRHLWLASSFGLALASATPRGRALLQRARGSVLAVLHRVSA